MSSDKITLIDEFFTKDFNACGETGDSVANKLKQLRRILFDQILIKIGKLPPEEALKIINVFSIQHKFENQIQCYVDTDYFGENPKVVKFKDLSLKEQNSIKEYITSLLVSIRNYAKEGVEKKLLQSSSNSLKFFYSPKKTDYNQCGAALIFPGFDFVYLVNGQPVLVMWGFEKPELNFDFHKELERLFTSIPADFTFQVEDLQNEQSSIRTSDFNNSLNSDNVINTSSDDITETVYPEIYCGDSKTGKSSSLNARNQRRNYNSQDDYVFNEPSSASDGNTYSQTSSNYENDNYYGNTQSQPSSNLENDNYYGNTQSQPSSNFDNDNSHDNNQSQSLFKIKTEKESVERIEERLVEKKPWDWKVWLLILLSILFFIILVLLIWYLFFYLEKEEKVLTRAEIEIIAKTPSTEPVINDIVANPTPTVSLQNKIDEELPLYDNTNNFSVLSDSETGLDSGLGTTTNNSSTGVSSSRASGPDDLDSLNNDNASIIDNYDNSQTLESTLKDNAIVDKEIEIKDENLIVSKIDATTQESLSSYNNTLKDSEPKKQNIKNKTKLSSESKTPSKSNEELNGNNNSTRKKQSQDNKANYISSDKKNTSKVKVSSAPNIKGNRKNNQSDSTKTVDSVNYSPSGIKLHNKDLSLVKNVNQDDVVINAYDTKNKNFVCALKGNVKRTQGTEDYHLSTSSSLCNSLKIEKITCKGELCIINGNPGQRVDLFE